MKEPEAIAFVNNYLRPFCERKRAVDVLAQEMDREYTRLSAHFTADLKAIVDDGRNAEGVSRLVCADVGNVITLIRAEQSAMDAVGAREKISKPCVRALAAS